MAAHIRKESKNTVDGVAQYFKPQTLASEDWHKKLSQLGLWTMEILSALAGQIYWQCTQNTSQQALELIKKLRIAVLVYFLHKQYPIRLMKEKNLALEEAQTCPIISHNFLIMQGDVNSAKWTGKRLQSKFSTYRIRLGKTRRALCLTSKNQSCDLMTKYLRRLMVATQSELKKARLHLYKLSTS